MTDLDEEKNTYRSRPIDVDERAARTEPGADSPLPFAVRWEATRTPTAFSRPIDLIKTVRRPIADARVNALNKDYGVPKQTSEGDPDLGHKPASPPHVLYYFASRYVQGMRVFLQMIIGVLLVYKSGTIFIQGAFSGPDDQLATDLLQAGAAFLAASTVVELAWLLFTPGPDEAVDPVILALATTALLLAGLVTGDDPEGLHVAGLGLSTLLLVVLLLLRSTLTKEVRPEAAAGHDKLSKTAGCSDTD